jgi:nicotinamidase-related amidase
VLVVGAEAHVCVMQTALGLVDQGFEVWMVVDGCGSRYLADKTIAMNRLQASGARLSSTEATLFEWLGSADHPQFRAVLNLIKSRDSLA